VVIRENHEDARICHVIHNGIVGNGSGCIEPRCHFHAMFSLTVSSGEHATLENFSAILPTVGNVSGKVRSETVDGA